MVDTLPDENHPGVQADCRVVWRIPKQDPEDPTRVIFEEDSTSLPQCASGATNGKVPTDCWQLTRDLELCPVNGQLVNVLRTASEIEKKPRLDPGTQIDMQCRTCTDPIPIKNPDPNNPRNIQPGCNYKL